MLRIVLFLFMAAGMAVFLFVAYASLHPPVPQAPVAAKVHVLAAAQTLRAGSLMKPDDLEVREMLETEEPAGASIDTPEARSKFFGAMVRQTLLQHQVVLPADIMRPGDHGFLAAVLTPGRRATSVGVDAVSGTAGLIWPGDHVDVILTQEMADQTGTGSHRVAAETVLKDVRVIAIDQQLVQGAAGSNGEAGSRTVTLEVTPEDVERVAVVSKLGHLSLAVRPVDAAPSDQGSAHPVTWAGDVSNAYSPSKSPDPTSTVVHVNSGTSDKDYHF